MRQRKIDRDNKGEEERGKIRGENIKKKNEDKNIEKMIKKRKKG